MATWMFGVRPPQLVENVEVKSATENIIEGSYIDSVCSQMLSSFKPLEEKY